METFDTSDGAVVFIEDAVQIAPTVQNTDNKNALIPNEIIYSNCFKTREHARSQTIKRRIIEMA